MKLTKVVVTSALLCLLVVLPATAAEFSPALEAQLAGAASSELISAIVILESPIDIQALDLQLHEEKVALDERHRRVLDALKYNAETTQPAFRQELELAKSKGQVAGYTAYWIENLFVIQATRGFLESLRDRMDVRFAAENFKAELIDPIPADPNALPRRDRNPLDNETTTDSQDAMHTTQVNRELGITGQGVLVANLDTGVEGTHPALASRWRGNFAPVSECWLDVLGGVPTPDDNNSHGTHVMGTMCGRAISGSDTNTIGSAPDAQWIACNAIDQGVGSAFDNDVIAAFQWFADPDGNAGTMEDVPDVIQNSWGVNGDFTGYADCFDYWNAAILNCEAAGPVITWSAGNEGPSSATLRSPATYSMNAYQIFSVGAVDCEGTSVPYPIADFSSRGPSSCTPAAPDNIKPEISAPGVGVYSSVPGASYGLKSGTSMAGPHVAGVVALMRQACPDCDHITIKDAIMQTAVDYGAAGQDNTYGYGFIDAYEAVLAVSNLGRVGGIVDDGADPLEGVKIQITSGTNQTLTDGSGQYYLPLSAGTYDLEFSKLGYITQIITGVTVIEGDTVDQNVSLVALTPVVVLEEDFESGAPGWTHDAAVGWVDQWHLSTERANSGTQSYKCGDTGTGAYVNLCDSRLVSPVLSNLPMSTVLSFVLQIESETSGAFPDSAYDGGIVEISEDGTVWTQVIPMQGYTKTFRVYAGGTTPVTGPMPGLRCFAGTNTTWTEYLVDLSAYEGLDLQVRFRFGSDASSTLEGWYVDDVLVQGYTDALAAPTELTVRYDSAGDNLIFDWNSSGAPEYALFSSASSDGPYTTLVATTSGTSLTLPLPLDEQLHYVVKATNGGALFSAASPMTRPVSWTR